MRLHGLSADVRHGAVAASAREVLAAEALAAAGVRDGHARTGPCPRALEL